MGLEEARRLRRAEQEKEKLKPEITQRTTRSQSQSQSQIQSDKTPEMEHLAAQKILLIGSEPDTTPYRQNPNVSADTNVILEKLHDEKMDRLKAEYKHKKQMVEYFEAIMEDRIQKAKNDCLLTIAELDEEITGDTGKIQVAVAAGNLEINRNIKSIWSEISDLKIANAKNKGVSSDEVVDDIAKKVTEKIKDDIKMPSQAPKGRMAPRQRAEIMKDNYLRSKSLREIVIRGLKNDINVEAIEAARNAIENNITLASFDRSQVVAAQWKGRDVEMAKRDTLVALFDNEASRQEAFENLKEDCKKRTAKVFFRQGMCPSDLKRFRELHEKFDEFEKAGKLVQGAKCSIKGNNGHYYLPKKIFKNVEDSEETDEQTAEADAEDDQRPQKSIRTRKKEKKNPKATPKQATKKQNS